MKKTVLGLLFLSSVSTHANCIERIKCAEWSDGRSDIEYARNYSTHETLRALPDYVFIKAVVQVTLKDGSTKRISHTDINDVWSYHVTTGYKYASEEMHVAGKKNQANTAWKACQNQLDNLVFESGYCKGFEP